jgi:hypothetical protein
MDKQETSAIYQNKFLDFLLNAQDKQAESFTLDIRNIYRQLDVITTIPVIQIIY